MCAMEDMYAQETWQADAHSCTREVVSMDFITGLPVSSGFDAIMTAVDKLSKRPRYAPTHTNTDAPHFARLFLMLSFDTTVCQIL